MTSEINRNLYLGQDKSCSSPLNGATKNIFSSKQYCWPILESRQASLAKKIWQVARPILMTIGKIVGGAVGLALSPILAPIYIGVRAGCHADSKGFSTASCMLLTFTATVLSIPCSLCIAGFYILKQKYFPNSLMRTINNAKRGEEVAKFNALKMIESQHPLPNLVGMTHKLSCEKESDFCTNLVVKNKITRHLIRQRVREGLDIHELNEINTEAERLIQQLANRLYSDKKVTEKKEIGELKQENENLMRTLEIELSAFQNPEKAMKEFTQQLNKLKKLLMNTPDSKDAEEVNGQIIESLRKVLLSDVYQALKEDTTTPSIQFLHHLASAIWNDVKVMNYYQDIGSHIFESFSQDDKNLLREALLSESTSRLREDLVGMIRKSLSIGIQQIPQDEHLVDKVEYAIMHPRQAVASYASEMGDSNPIQREILGPYDPHSLHNSPSLQGTTTYSIDHAPVRINNVYGGSPTIDNHVAPEFLAVLQAAENNQSADPKGQISGVPSIVIYTNLQNISSKGGEGMRSRSIMRLNELYPLSFFGITLAKDTHFHTPGPKEIKGLQWSSPAQFGKEMLTQLNDDSSFKLVREKKDHKNTKGFYFPGKPEDWKPVFEKAIEAANQEFKEYQQNCAGEKALELRTAYQEYFYAFLQIYQELKAVESLSHLGRRDLLAMSIRVCKENYDRGGMENGKFFYTRVDQKERLVLNKSDEFNFIKLFFGVIQSRPAMERKRGVLPKRTPPVLNFIKHVNPVDFTQRQVEMCKGVLKSRSITYDGYQIAFP